MDDLGEQLRRLAAHWNQIEDRIKEVEQIRAKVVIPAINELRYAGRKFIDAWGLYAKENRSEQDLLDMQKCIVVAEQYLMNADHDAIDAGLSFIYKNLGVVTKRYKVAKIAAHVPDLLAALDEVDENRPKIIASRRDRTKRNEIYNSIVPHYERMIGIHQQVDRAERYVLRKQKRVDFFINLFAVLGVLGSIASIVALIVAWDQVKSFVRAFF